MEINPKHQLVRNLVAIYTADPRMPFVNQTCHQLYDNAMLLEGFPPDMHEMVSRLQAMMADMSQVYVDKDDK